MSDKVLEQLFKSFSDTEEELDFRVANDFGDAVEVISTGSPSLDDALSSGGYPLGRIIQLYGPSHSGKTLMAMIGIAQAQKANPAARQLFIDAEGTFSTVWAETLGINTSKVIIVDGDTAVNGRKLFEMFLGVPKEDKQHIFVGKSKEGLLDKIKDKTLDFNFIVLDSLGAIIPPGEDISAVGKMNMSLLSRFLTTTMRKLSLEVKKANIPFIIINHKRDVMDPYASSDHTFTGGNTYTHFLSATIYFEAILRKDAQIFDDNEKKIGHKMRAKVEKSKFGPSPRQCELKVDFSKGIVDRHEEIAKLAVDNGVVEKPTSVSHQYDGKKWVGFPNFCEALKEDTKLCDKIEKDINELRKNKLTKKSEPETKKLETKKEKEINA
jgi:recombination protein RecA